MPDTDPPEITGKDLEALTREYGRKAPGLERVKSRTLQQIRKEREAEINPQSDGTEKEQNDCPEID